MGRNTLCKNFIGEETWGKCENCLFSVFHWTGSSQKMKNSYIEKSIGTNVTDSSHMIVFYSFLTISYPIFPCYEKLMGKTMHFSWDVEWELDQIEVAILWKQYRSLPGTALTLFSQDVRNWWENPCTFNTMQKTIEFA